MDDKQKLIDAATDVRSQAYAPYSGYRVGAAIQSRDGRVFTGANVENSAYPTCLCAETNALGSAISDGAREFTAIAICTQPEDGKPPAAPCGNCRQALSEFALDLKVYLVSVDGQMIEQNLQDLLPAAFNKEDL